MHTSIIYHRRHATRRGFALLMVVIVLSTMLLIAVPFSISI